jgi:hypothetical protein
MKTLFLLATYIILFSTLPSTKGFASVVAQNLNKVTRMFDNQEFNNNWRITNDSVMGGRSNGEISLDNNIVRFSGLLSIENNGGFTSVFSDSFSLSSEIDTVTITVVGDGKKYQLRMRSELSGYIIAYKTEFQTKPNLLETYTFELSDFQASFRGRNISNAPKLNADSIREIGFLFTSKRTEKFSLSIHSIDFSNKQTEL